MASWSTTHTTPPNNTESASACQQERSSSQTPQRQPIRPVAEEGTTEAHQLLSADRKRGDGSRKLNLLNQQTVEKAKCEDAQNAQTQLKHPEPEPKSS